MRSVLPSHLLFATMILAASSTVLHAQNGAWASKGLKPSNKVKMPAFSASLLEITAERLAMLERAIQTPYDGEAARKERETADVKHRAWEDCRKRTFTAAQPPAQQTEAQMNARTAELQKLATEYVDKIKNAKTSEERQQLAMEMSTKQRAIMAPAAQAQASQQSQMDARCGSEPEHVAPKNAERGPLPPGYGRIIERAVEFCDFPATGFVAPDGTISTAEQPYWDEDKGMAMSYHVAIYSAAEAKLLQPRCPSLLAMLRSAGYIAY